MQRCLFLHPVAVIFHKGFHNGVFLLLLLTFLLQNLIRDPIAKARLERRVFTSIIRYRPFFLCCNASRHVANQRGFHPILPRTATAQKVPVWKLQRPFDQCLRDHSWLHWPENAPWSVKKTGNAGFTLVAPLPAGATRTVDKQSGSRKHHKSQATLWPQADVVVQVGLIDGLQARHVCDHFPLRSGARLHLPPSSHSLSWW